MSREISVLVSLILVISASNLAIADAHSKKLEDLQISTIGTQANQEVYSRFRFKSPESRTAIAQIISKRFNLLLKDEANDSDPQTRSLSNLFWNLVESVEKESHSPEEIRPLVHELSAQTTTKESLLELYQMSRMVRAVLLHDNDAYLGSIDYPDKLLFLIRAIRAPDLNDHPYYKKYYVRYLADCVRSLLKPEISPLTRAKIFELTSRLAPEVAKEIYRNQLFEKKLVFISKAQPSMTPTPSAQWDFNTTYLAGRCGGTSDSISGSSLENFAKGISCRYGDDGVDSIAQVSLDYVKTENISGTHFFRASVRSYFKGGWRHGGIFRSPPEEDETSEVHYRLKGKVTLPVCTNIILCRPLVRVFFSKDESADAKVEVSVNSPALGGTVIVDPAQGLLVDRSQYPAEIAIQLSRDGSYLGSSGEQPLQANWVDVNVDDATEIWKPTFLYGAFSKLDAAVLNWSAPKAPLLKIMTVGEALASIDSYFNSNAAFDERYQHEYAELSLINDLLNTASNPPSSTERELLELTRNQISLQTKERWQSTLQALIAERSNLVAMLPILKLHEEISRLLESKSSISPTEVLEVMNKLNDTLQPSLVPSATTHGQLEPISHAVRLIQASQDQINDNPDIGILRLMEIESDLMDLEESWKSDTTLLSAELAQISTGAF